MITVEIDELTNCLIENATGKEVETIVQKISDPSLLTGYTSKNGWYVNWKKLFKNNEVYALYVAGNKEVQGLVALKDDVYSDAVFANWIVANPHNSGISFSEKKQYTGVGGHLFAIACNRSFELGHSGVIQGYALNLKLLNHYLNVFGAEYLGFLHPYQFKIEENNAKILVEKYTYDLRL